MIGIQSLSLIVGMEHLGALVTEDLAKRAVACKHWRWMPGSAFDTGLRYDEFAQFMLDDWEGEIPDLTDPATLVAATAGVSTLAICVGASPSVSSALQKAIEWTGVQNQVAALASQTSVASKHVLLVSSMGTTSCRSARH